MTERHIETMIARILSEWRAAAKPSTLAEEDLRGLIAETLKPDVARQVRGEILESLTAMERFVELQRATAEAALSKPAGSATGVLVFPIRRLRGFPPTPREAGWAAEDQAAGTESPVVETERDGTLSISLSIHPGEQLRAVVEDDEKPVRNASVTLRLVDPRAGSVKQLQAFTDRDGVADLGDCKALVRPHAGAFYEVTVIAPAPDAAP